MRPRVRIIASSARPFWSSTAACRRAAGVTVPVSRKFPPSCSRGLGYAGRPSTSSTDSGPTSRATLRSAVAGVAALRELLVQGLGGGVAQGYGEQGGRVRGRRRRRRRAPRHRPRRSSPIALIGSRNGAKALAAATASKRGAALEVDVGARTGSAGPRSEGDSSSKRRDLAGQDRVLGVVVAVHVDAQRDVRSTRRPTRRPARSSTAGPPAPAAARRRCGRPRVVAGSATARRASRPSSSRAARAAGTMSLSSGSRMADQRDQPRGVVLVVPPDREAALADVVGLAGRADPVDPPVLVVAATRPAGWLLLAEQPGDPAEGRAGQRHLERALGAHLARTSRCRSRLACGGRGPGPRPWCPRPAAGAARSGARRRPAPAAPPPASVPRGPSSQRTSEARADDWTNGLRPPATAWVRCAHEAGPAPSLAASPARRGRPSARGAFSCPSTTDRTDKDDGEMTEQDPAATARDDRTSRLRRPRDGGQVAAGVGEARPLPRGRRQPAREALRPDDVPLPERRPAHGSRRGDRAARRDRALLVAAAATRC